MAKMQFWDKQTDITFPRGFSTAADFLKEHPEAAHGKTVVEMIRGVTVGIHSFGTLCNVYKVPDDLDDNAALAYIETVISERQNAAPSPSETERIAAALEFQNLMSI